MQYIDILKSENSDPRDLTAISRKAIQYRTMPQYDAILKEIDDSFPRNTLIVLKTSINEAEAQWTIYVQYPNLAFLKEIELCK